MKWRWPWGRKSRKLPSPETLEAVRDAAAVRARAEKRLQMTQAKTPVVEAVGARLEDQLRNHNHIGRLFDHAIRGTK